MFLDNRFDYFSGDYMDYKKNKITYYDGWNLQPIWNRNKTMKLVDDANYVIINYSIYDAIESCFNYAVFIICKDIEKKFKEAIDKLLNEGKMSVKALKTKDTRYEII